MVGSGGSVGGGVGGGKGSDGGGSGGDYGFKPDQHRRTGNQWRQKMTDTAIANDITRCADRLAHIKRTIDGGGDNYSEQRRAAMMITIAFSDTMIEMAESLNWIACTGEPSDTDRSNIRSYVYDGFIEAIDAADAKMRERDAILAQREKDQ